MSLTLCEGDTKTLTALASQCLGLISQTRLSDVILLFFLSCNSWTKLNSCRLRRPKIPLIKDGGLLLFIGCWLKGSNCATTKYLTEVCQGLGGKAKNYNVGIGRHYHERKALAEGNINSLNRESGKLKHNTVRWNKLFQVTEQVCGKGKNP